MHLVDGTLELFRCFHGAPRATDEQGRQIGAARALLWTASRLLRKEGATHVAVAFDRMAPPRRADTGDDALLRSQGALALEVVRAVGFTVWPAVRNQADDLLATGARLLADQVDQVVLCTTDKDLLQCIRGQSVVLRDRTRDRITDEPALLERFGVRPEQIPDRTGLVGDPSDGLPGVPGWGDKSAAAVLSTYPRIENIPSDPTQWTARVRGAARLSEALEARRAEALVVRDLATLRTDLALRIEIDALRWTGPRPELRPLAARLGATEVVDKLMEHVDQLQPE